MKAKKKSRLCSMLLTIGLLCSMMVMPVSAATTHMDVNTTTIGKVQIAVKDSDPNAKVSLYQIVQVLNTMKGETHGESEELETEASGMRWMVDKDDASQSAIGTWAKAYAAGKRFGPAGSEVTLTLENPDELNKMTQEQAAAFYQALAREMVTNSAMANKVHKIDAANGSTSGTTTTYTFNTIDGNASLVTGAYLAVGQSGINVYATTSVNVLPYRDAEDNNRLKYPVNKMVEMKASTTSIEKRIIDDTDSSQSNYKEATVAVGDTVTFQIDTGVPKYQGDFDVTKIRYTIVDVMRNSYKYVDGSMSAYGMIEGSTDKNAIASQNYALSTTGSVYVNNSGEAIFVQLGSSTFHGLNGEDMSGASTVAEAVTAYNTAHSTAYDTSSVTKSEDYTGVVLDFYGAYAVIGQYDKLTFEYKTTITDKELDSVKTNTNTAHLNYSVSLSNPDQINTVKDVVTSYTYGLDIEKVDGNDIDMKLNGVYFDLYRLEGSTMSQSEVDELRGSAGFVADNYEITQNEGANNYTVYKLIKKDLVTGNYTDLTPDAAPEGLIKVNGLDLGTYKLVETATQAGYNLLEGPIRITLSQAPNDGQHEMLTGSTSGRAKEMVQNFKGITLPSTGGVGTTLFFLFGIMLMGGAIAVLVYRSRRNYNI